MILFTNGCSHTAGAELDFPQQDSCYEKAWPKHLGELLNAEKVVNLANSGASQYRITRTTIEYVGKLIHEGNWVDLKNLFVVIMWPGPHRIEGYAEELGGFYNIVVGNDEVYQKNLPKPHYEFYKSWVTTFCQEKADSDFYLSVIQLQNYLGFLKIPYLFWNASNSALSSNRELYFMYQNQINKKRFPYYYLSEQGYTYLAKSNGHQISVHSQNSGFNSHYDEDTHRWWAKYLFRYIQLNDLLSSKTSK